MGISTFTNKYKPWELIYYEAFRNKQDAHDREMKLKHHGNGIRLLKERLLNSLKNGAGFTLIETIVVVVVIGLTLPVIFSIFFVLLQQQTKIYRLNTVKKEGDYIISLIENTIKNEAVTILSSTSPIPPDATNKKCDNDSTSYSSTSSLYFLNKNGLWFGYFVNGNTIASSSASLASIDLTSSKTRISSFSISCSRTYMYSPPSISLNFNIEYCNDVACNQARPEEIASLFYQTKIKLRNY